MHSEGPNCRSSGIHIFFKFELEPIWGAITMRVTIEGEKIFYVKGKASAPTTVLAIHGSGGDHTHWPYRLNRLPDVGFIAVDLPGHGASAGDGRLRVEAYADFIESMVATLALPRVILMGHSLGGAIVQTIALREPSWLAGLILVGTGARLRVHQDILDGLRLSFEATVDRVCRRAYGPTASPELIRTGREGLLGTSPDVLFGDYTACDKFDRMAVIHNIRLPTLVVAGDADRLTPLKYGEYLREHILGARLAVIHRGGHMMAVEQPEIFTQHVGSFLATFALQKDR